jgi:hypothetical protein
MPLMGPRQEKSDGSVIYHYTSLQTLKSILREKVLWASNPVYLNDAQELGAGRARVLSAVQAIANDVRTSERLSADSDNPEWLATMIGNYTKLLEGEFRPESYASAHLFITSFCEEKDLLSQWRGYGQDGCAIGFHRDALLNDFKMEGRQADLVKVHYGSGLPSELEGKLRQEVTPGDVYGRGDDSAAQNAILRCMASLKDFAFAEEKEWRLIVTLDYEGSFSGNGLTPEFRITNGRVIPYISVPFRSSSIAEIVIGPGRHMAQNVQAIKWVTDMRNIVSSRVPYVAG